MMKTPGCREQSGTRGCAEAGRGQRSPPTVLRKLDFKVEEPLTDLNKGVSGLGVFELLPPAVVWGVLGLGVKIQEGIFGSALQ